MSSVKEYLEKRFALEDGIRNIENSLEIMYEHEMSKKSGIECGITRDRYKVVVDNFKKIDDALLRTMDLSDRSMLISLYDRYYRRVCQNVENLMSLCNEYNALINNGGDVEALRKQILSVVVKLRSSINLYEKLRFKRFSVLGDGLTSIKDGNLLLKELCECLIYFESSPRGRIRKLSYDKANTMLHNIVDQFSPEQFDWVNSQLSSMWMNDYVKKGLQELSIPSVSSIHGFYGVEKKYSKDYGIGYSVKDILHESLMLKFRYDKFQDKLFQNRETNLRRLYERDAEDVMC